MIALALLCGAGVGLGLVLIAAGARRLALAPRSPRRVSGWWAITNVRLAGAVAAGVLVGAITRWPVAALLAAAGAVALPGFVGGGRSRAAAIARVEAVAGWTEMLRDTIAGAAGLEQAIVATATVAPAPIRGDVVALARRIAAGEPLPAALAALADDIADPTCDLVVAALVMASQHHAQRLTDLLSSLAIAAREQVAVRLRIDAGRARTRTSIRVVIGSTIGLVAGISILNRGYLAPYDTAAGQLVLLVIGALFATAFAWLARMARHDTPARLLTRTRSEATS